MLSWVEINLNIAYKEISVHSVSHKRKRLKLKLMLNHY